MEISCGLMCVPSAATASPGSISKPVEVFKSLGNGLIPTDLQRATSTKNSNSLSAIRFSAPLAHACSKSTLLGVSMQVDSTTSMERIPSPRRLVSSVRSSLTESWKVSGSKCTPTKACPWMAITIGYSLAHSKHDAYNNAVSTHVPALFSITSSAKRILCPWISEASAGGRMYAIFCSFNASKIAPAICLTRLTLRDS